MSCAFTRAVTQFLRRKSEESESLDVEFIELMCAKVMMIPGLIKNTGLRFGSMKQ